MPQAKFQNPVISQNSLGLVVPKHFSFSCLLNLISLFPLTCSVVDRATYSRTADLAGGVLAKNDRARKTIPAQQGAGFLLSLILIFTSLAPHPHPPPLASFFFSFSSLLSSCCFLLVSLALFQLISLLCFLPGHWL